MTTLRGGERCMHHLCTTGGERCVHCIGAPPSHAPLPLSGRKVRLSASPTRRNLTELVPHNPLPPTFARINTGRLCGMPDCPKPHQAKGFCGMHYKRAERTGTPFRPPLAERTPPLGQCDVCDKIAGIGWSKGNLNRGPNSFTYSDTLCDDCYVARWGPQDDYVAEEDRQLVHAFLVAYVYGDTEDQS